MSATADFLDALEAPAEDDHPMIEIRLTERAAYKADVHLKLMTTYVPVLDEPARIRLRTPDRDWITSGEPRCYVLLLTLNEIAALKRSAKVWCPELYNLLKPL